MTEHSPRQPRTSALDEMGWSAASGAFLKRVAKELKWKQAHLAEEAGISRSTLLAIFGGLQTPREETLEEICRVLGVTRDEVLDPAHRNSVGPADKDQPMAGDVRIGSEEFSLVKRYGVKASAGPGRFPLSESVSGGVLFARPWLIRRGIPADMAGLIIVTGDSMAPTIPDGSTVLVHFLPMVENEGIYVISRDGEVLVKRIQPIEMNADGRPAALAILSDNPEYPPAMVFGERMNEVRIVGRVRSVLTDL